MWWYMNIWSQILLSLLSVEVGIFAGEEAEMNLFFENLKHLQSQK